MALDPQAQKVLETLATLGFKSFEELTPEEARAQQEAFPRPEGETVGSVVDRTIPGPDGHTIPVRIYTPAPHTGPTRPGVVYYHGGGWVFGNLESHDYTCRALCNASGAVIVAVDYRLAPEHKFPAAAEDAYAATAWVAENASSLRIDAHRLAVAGDSAGGNLAAVVSQLARERGGPRLALQALVYPVTDYNFETASYRENAEGYLLTRAGMIWFWDHYLGGPHHADDPRCSPLRAKDFSGLPPALVITAGYDPLRDEGEAYARKLQEAGVAVTLSPYPGMIHGFFGNPAMDAGAQAVKEVGAAIRAL